MGVLKNLIVPSKTVEVEYPGLDGFSVSLAYLTKDELIKLRKKATTKKLSRSSKAIEEEVDSELFQKLYIDEVIKGWKGLKYKYLNQLLPIDLAQIEDSEEELDYDKENAYELMRNSRDFDEWVSVTLEDVTNFTKSS